MPAEAQVAEYRTVRMDFWGDPFTEALPPDGKLLYLYLFTCSQTNNLGLLDISRRRMAFESGLQESRVEDLLRFLEAEGKLVIDGTAVWLRNFIRHQTSTSPMILKGLIRLFPGVVSESIRREIRATYPAVPWPEHGLSIPCAEDMHTLCTPSAKKKRKKKKEREEGCSAPAAPDAARAGTLSGRHKTGNRQGEECYLTHAKRPLKGLRLETFNRFWQAFAYARGKAEAADAWLDIPGYSEALAIRIIAAAEREAAGRPDLVAAGRTPKMAQGWLSGRRWEDCGEQEQGVRAAGQPRMGLEEFAALSRERERDAPARVSR